jgi:hypothetical protein
MPIEPLVDTLISLIQKNIVAKTDITSDVLSGANTVSVKNSFHFRANQEIVLIDYGYNIEGSEHYQIFEYAKIKKINNTRSISLYSPVQGSWLTSNNAFIQKTVGHSPLYDNHIYFGDREVIPPDQMAVCIEPVSMSNEWRYVQGGLNEDYKLKVITYGKDIQTSQGLTILTRYTDNISQLLNENIHAELVISSPLLSSATVGSTIIIVEDTIENRENLTTENIILPSLKDLRKSYRLQDNLGVECFIDILSVEIEGGLIRLTINPPVNRDFLLSEFAVIEKYSYNLWDSRADLSEYGVVQKGSAILRASEINWYVKMINEFSFPQSSLDVEKFEQKGGL